ncbi:MAG: TetR/AcrR family transcriptional regulator [bacterium]|nr:TetR/AcrR family transcriptional regulator [bacterium]
MVSLQRSDNSKTTGKDQAILLAAQTLFAQFGHKKVTMDEIAGNARVSKATLYKYFRNKDQVFDQVVQMEAEELMRLIRGAVDKEQTIEDKLKAHLLTRMGKIHELINYYRVTQESWGDFWPHLANTGQSFVRKEERIVRDVLEQGMRAGELDIERLGIVAHLTVIALKAIDFPWVLKDNEVTAQEYADQMVHMMMNGIRKR